MSFLIVIMTKNEQIALLRYSDIYHKIISLKIILWKIVLPVNLYFSLRIREVKINGLTLLEHISIMRENFFALKMEFHKAM